MSELGLYGMYFKGYKTYDWGTGLSLLLVAAERRCTESSEDFVKIHGVWHIKRKSLIEYMTDNMEEPGRAYEITRDFVRANLIGKARQTSRGTVNDRVYFYAHYVNSPEVIEQSTDFDRWVEKMSVR